MRLLIVAILAAAALIAAAVALSLAMPMPMCPSCRVYMGFYMALPLATALAIALVIYAALYGRRPPAQRAEAPPGDAALITKLLPKPERDIYLELARRGGEAPLSEVAKSLGLRKVRAWRAAKRLEEKGLVKSVKVKGRVILKIKREAR